MHHVRGDAVLNGNIGCGKTTVIARMRDLGYLVFDEPQGDWEYLLRRIYHNREFHLLPLFQWRVMHYYCGITEELLKLGPDRPPVVVARSPSSVMLFVLNNKEHFTTAFIMAMHEITDMLNGYTFWRDATHFMMFQTAEQCHHNMTARKGVESGSVSLAYLISLEELHVRFEAQEKWRRISAVDLDEVVQAVVDLRNE